MKNPSFLKSSSSNVPKIMGILNCTPDSFSDGGLYQNVNQCVARVQQMIHEGADLIDVGGESTRPGANPVSAAIECERIIPIIRAIRKVTSVPLSVDTTKSEVALEALQAGANIVNDVSGLTKDSCMVDVIKKNEASVIIMHSRGDPPNRQHFAVYKNLVQEVCQELEQSVQYALQAGISPLKIIIDPGFGFAKTSDQNINLLKELHQFLRMGYPLLVGLSRKSFIGHILNEADPQKRIDGSIAAALYAVNKGASCIRVHDVQQTRQALDVWMKLNQVITHNP